MQTCTDTKQHGFSMIEILITLVIVSLALLGSAGLQAYAIKTNLGGQYRNQAAFLVADIVERMEANKLYSVTTSGYNTGLAQTIDCTTNNCSPTQLAAYDMTNWQSTVSGVLPSGTGTVTQLVAGNPSTYQVTVNWVDRKTNAQYSAASAAAATENYSITSNIQIGK